MPPTIAQVYPGAAVSIILKADQRSGRQVSGIVQDLLTRGNHPRGIKVRLTDGRIGRVQQATTGGGAGLPPDASARGGSGVRYGGAVGAVRSLNVAAAGDAAGDSGAAGTAAGSAAGTATAAAFSMLSLETRSVGWETREDGEEVNVMSGSSGQQQQQQQQPQRRPQYTDVRLEEELNLPDSRYELAAFIRAPRTRSKKRPKKGAAASAAATTTTEAKATEEETAVAAAAAVVSCPVCQAFDGDEIAVARHVEEHFT